MTLSGKTTIAKRLTKKAQSSGRNVLVFDPLLDPSWECDAITDDMSEFLELVRKNKNCTLIVDEAGTVCSNHDKDTHWLATQARHWGHQTFFISQRPSQIAVNIRDNCSHLFCFRISQEDAKTYANEWCTPEIAEAPKLGKGECIYITRFGGVQRFNVFDNNA